MAPATWRRWRDLVAYAAVGSALWTSIASTWPQAVRSLIALPMAAAVPVLVLLLAVLVWEGHGRLSAFLGLKYPWRYPPTWLAGAVGAAAIVPLLNWLRLLPFEESLSTTLCWVGVIFLTAPLLVFAIASILIAIFQGSESGPGEAAPSTKKNELSGYDSIVAWLKDDRPIEEPGQDRFGLNLVARRTAKRLASREGSQLVVGDLGSGKTSLRCLVHWNLARAPGGKRIQLVEVELWQYETARAAVAGVIAELVSALGKHVNIASVGGVRPQYLAAMSEAGGIAAVIATTVHGKRSPYDSLQAIDEVAGAIGLHLAIWIEDLERFLDGGAEVGAVREAKLLNPLRALVHGLDRLDHVSVTTATTSLVGRFDSEKIARFVEEVPRLRVLEVARLLADFREGMRTNYPDDIDPVGHDDPRILRAPQLELDQFGNKYASLFRRQAGAPKRAAESLVHMLPTPRKLKQALRLIHAAWSKLHGEVDRDDLILMAGLRAGSPEGFAIIRDHYFELQRLSWPEEQRGEQHFSSALDSLGMTHERQAVWTIAQEVFDRAHGVRRPQGLHVARYWERFLTEEAPEEDERDQRVLKAIRDGDNQMLVSVLASGGGPNVENFNHLIPDEMAWGLLVPLCTRLVDVDPSTWETAELFGGNAPGVVNLWRTWTYKVRLAEHNELSTLLEEVSSVLEEAVSVAVANLGLLRDVEYYYLSHDSRSPGLLFGTGVQRGEALAARVRARLHERLLERYCGPPELLLRELGRAPPYSLKRLIWGSARCKDKQLEGIPFEGWEQFAPSLLEAAAVDPEVALPELAVLVVRETGEHLVKQQMKTVYEFDDELCARLFGDAATVLSLPWGQLPEETRTHGCVDAVKERLLLSSPKAPTGDEQVVTSSSDFEASSTSTAKGQGEPT